MKKRMRYLLVLFSIVGLLSGCSDYETASKNILAVIEEEGNYFTTINSWFEKGNQYYLVYANDTKVMYLKVCGTYVTDFTPLFNADGTLQVYEETAEEECTCINCINN